MHHEQPVTPANETLTGQNPKAMLPCMLQKVCSLSRREHPIVACFCHQASNSICLERSDKHLGGQPGEGSIKTPAALAGTA